MPKISTLHGDCLSLLDLLPDDTFDACVTDPPYHLTSIVKRFGKPGSAPAKDRDGLYARASRGFMGKQWDGGDIAFRPDTWAELGRVLKPGAHLLAFGGTRTFHRMAVAIEDGLVWLDLVSADMEGEGYAFGAVDTCAAGFGAPHIRQRLYWVADSVGAERRTVPGRGRDDRDGTDSGRQEAPGRLKLDRPVDGLADHDRNGCAPAPEPGVHVAEHHAQPCRGHVELGDALGQGLALGSLTPDEHGVIRVEGAAVGPTGALHGPWADADWLYCTDGKWRPAEPCSRPLAHGTPSRVGRLRAYGNAIVAEQAQGFIEAYMGGPAGPERPIPVLDPFG